jgi:sulfate adenylyltransferase subunit 2
VAGHDEKHQEAVRDVGDLVDESITIIREVVAEFENPAMLFSGGKDSVVMLHLAALAFKPARVPFPVVHIDTGHNFKEVIEFRDRTVEEMGVRLVVGEVEDSIRRGTAVEQTGVGSSRNPLQTITLLECIAEHRFDALFGGARRDEERARAKERVYSLRDTFGQWDPKNQRPELWGVYNGKHRTGEHFRIFPLSNWTELDIWNFIHQRNIELPSIYYAHEREVFKRLGVWMAVSEHLAPEPEEEVEVRTVRFRTVGDATCTAAVESVAYSIEDVLNETAAARITERGATRVDDKISEAGMEDRKRRGYF